MARAFGILTPGERAEEKKAETPDLVGVGCEICHGAGGIHIQPEEHMSLKNKEFKKADLVAVGLIDTINVEQCQRCHNTESLFGSDDYIFGFETRKKE